MFFNSSELLLFFLYNHKTLTKVVFVVQAVQANRFNRSVKKNGIGLTHASMGMPSFTDGPAEESKLTGVGEIRLVPDLSTKRTIPWYLARVHLLVAFNIFFLSFCQNK